jgi:hypothetical protein
MENNQNQDAGKCPVNHGQAETAAKCPVMHGSNTNKHRDELVQMHLILIFYIKMILLNF